MFDRERLVSFFSSHRTSGSLWAIALSRRGRDDTESPTNERDADERARDAMDERRAAASLLAVLVLSLVVSASSAAAGVAPAAPPDVLSSPAAAAGEGEGEGAEHAKKENKIKNSLIASLVFSS